MTQLAYIVSAYKLPDQLVRLVERLATEHTRFVIHYDKRSPRTEFEHLRHALEASPVAFVERHPSPWGSFGHIRATLKGIAHLVAHDVPFDYAVVLTGQDYPLKTNDEIRSFLRTCGSQALMEAAPVTNTLWNRASERYRKRHYHPLGRHLALPGYRRRPGSVQLFGGSPYWAMPAEMVRFVHDFTKRNPRFVRFFERTHIPDEMFFQTIIMNSPYADLVCGDPLHHVDWSEHRSRPRVLRSADLGLLARSPAPFARKFDTTADARILDLIDAEFLGRREPIFGIAGVRPAPGP